MRAYSALVGAFSLDEARPGHGRKVRALRRPAGKFRWRLKAGNGEITAQSQAY
ncbi:YegP family protein [Nocardia salmonicida]|uniref:YegP family protein n=1 Tax=Nocardia salmonicida TaxID=53431 RepID=UPI0033FB7F71